MKKHPKKTFSHSNTISPVEPQWSSIDKRKLPFEAHAARAGISVLAGIGFPHHWVKNGAVDEFGIWRRPFCVTSYN